MAETWRQMWPTVSSVAQPGSFGMAERRMSCQSPPRAPIFGLADDSLDLLASATVLHFTFGVLRFLYPHR